MSENLGPDGMVDFAGPDRVHPLGDKRADRPVCRPRVKLINDVAHRRRRPALAADQREAP